MTVIIIITIIISGAYERCKAAQNNVNFANHLLSNHTYANCLIWKTSVNCVSDLSRRDKCLLKSKNNKIIINRASDRNDTSIVSKG